VENYHGRSPAATKFTAIPAPLTAAQYHELLHGGHEHAVWFARLPWSQKEAPDKAEALAKLDRLQGCPDCYMTMNGFELFTTRESINARAVTSFYLDFDFYKEPALSGLSFWEVAQRIYDAAPWLPVATVTTDSGRGLYLIWILDRPVTDADEIKQWKEIETLLVDAPCFKTLGSDSSVKEAARVLRFPGSINSKSNSTVAAYQTGERVSMEAMREAALHCGAGKLAKSMSAPEKVRAAAADKVRVKQDNTPIGIVPENQKRLYSHIDRVIEQQIAPYLARNSIERKVPEGYRHHLLFNKCACLCWTVPDRMKREKLAREFVQKWLSEPGRFIGLEAVKTALHGSNGQRQGLSPKFIANLFDLPAPIRFSLMAIVYWKDKGTGKELRETKSARTEAENTEALRMLAEGKTIVAAANELGIEPNTLQKRLKRKQKERTSPVLVCTEAKPLHDPDLCLMSDCCLSVALESSDSEKSAGTSTMTPTPGALLSAFMVLKNILIPSPDVLPWEADPRSTGCPSPLLSSPSEARKLLQIQSVSPPLDDGFCYSVSGAAPLGYWRQSEHMIDFWTEEPAAFSRT